MKISLLLAIGTAVSAAAVREKRGSPTSELAADPAYTSSMLDQLWKNLDITTADVTTTVKGKPLTTEEVARPPNMPRFEYDDKLKLPKDFVWGVAGASYQIEGAAKADGKGPSIWDVITHLPNATLDGTNGDITDNHYYLYEQDAQRLKALGIPYYSMTISWPRIFPFGNGTVNQAGLQHYIDEVDYLLGQGIEPMITLHHWDMPYALQQAYGGWCGEQVVEDFGNYARVMFEALAPKVKYWFTINEPEVVSMQYKMFSQIIPSEVLSLGGVKPDEVSWVVGKNLLLAHTKATEIFENEFRHKCSDREITVKHSFQMGLPQHSQDKEDWKASNRSLDFNVGWFAEPLYGSGDWPESMKQTLGDKLPSLSKDEQKRIRNSISGSFCWDSYSSNLVKAPEGGVDACANNPKHELYPTCAEVVYVQEDGWQIGQFSSDGSDWLYNTPDLVRDSFNVLQKKWKPKHGFMMTEWGFSIPDESNMPLQEALTDTNRVNYYEGYMDMILRLVHEDKIDLRGAVAWSVLDNLEWTSGTNVRFGMQYVNYTTQERYFKKSAFVYADFFNKMVDSGDHHDHGGWWNWGHGGHHNWWWGRS